jgi:hypothetical protein
MSEGLHNVTITRVEDLGLQETMYGSKDQARIYFTAQDQKDKEGKAVECPMTVTCSLHPKSKLAKLLNTLGIQFSEETFDLNVVVGIKCQVVIEQAENKDSGQPYAKIVSVLKTRKSTPPTEV